MKSHILILIVAVSTCLICSCEDDIAQPPIELNGVYDGIFTVEYSEAPVFYEDQALSNEVTITFNDSIYSCSAGEDHLPAGGSGKFEINGSTITFYDENGWYADFDGNLILDGEYELSRDNSTIVISSNKNDVGFYKYELEKQ